ncbi:hypothetical protein CRG98_024518 [Punica granatum]|uniref:Uncharacterized protein n=1 Tax=Punica granatum TaxID=22663 RepID=A0A2I0JG38_PUNGR|nr:hypothetical protein CRG98_024518 [Punica granatum]
MTIILLVLCCLASKGVSKGLPKSYDAIYEFGDGESDTGNQLYVNDGPPRRNDIKKLPNDVVTRRRSGSGGGRTSPYGLFSGLHDTLRKEFPHAKIIHADYFNAAMLIYKWPQDFEFCSETLTACCGGGGPFNVNVSTWCGCPGSTLFPSAATFISLDGVNLTDTDVANGIIAKAIMHGPFCYTSLEEEAQDSGKQNGD